MNLSLAELKLVERELSPSFHVGSEKTTEPLASRTLCLKVGGALLEVGDENSVVVEFDEPELWLLRERLDIAAIAGANMRLGLDLKRKLYAELLALEVPYTGETVNVTELSKDEVNAALNTYERSSRADADAHPPRRARKKSSTPPEPSQDLP